MNSSPTEFIENITLRLGRSRKYFTSEEQAAAQRHNSLIHYHRKKQIGRASCRERVSIDV